jgi:hypothetical protein
VCSDADGEHLEASPAAFATGKNLLTAALSGSYMRLRIEDRDPIAQERGGGRLPGVGGTSDKETNETRKEAFDEKAPCGRRGRDVELGGGLASAQVWGRGRGP